MRMWWAWVIAAVVAVIVVWFFVVKPKWMNGSPAPGNPILIARPGDKIVVSEGGIERPAVFGPTAADNKVNPRYLGTGLDLWGEASANWKKGTELKISLDNDVVVTGTIGIAGLSWQEDSTASPNCGSGCAYDLPYKWNSEIDKIDASGGQFGSTTMVDEGVVDKP